MAAKTREQLDLWEKEQKAKILESLKSVCQQILDLQRADSEIYNILQCLQFPSRLGTYEEITQDGIRTTILNQIKGQLKLAKRADCRPIAALEELATAPHWHKCSWGNYGYEQVLARHAAATAISTQAMQQYAAQFRRPPQPSNETSEFRQDNVEETSQQSFENIYRELLEDTPEEIYARGYSNGARYVW